MHNLVGGAYSCTYFVSQESQKWYQMQNEIDKPTDRAHRLHTIDAIARCDILVFLFLFFHLNAL